MVINTTKTLLLAILVMLKLVLMKAKLSTKEIKEVAEKLNQLDPGFLPIDIFWAIARLVTTPTANFTGFRRHNNKLQVLFVRRDKDDKYLPNAWHVPGSVMMSTDKEHGFDSTYSRVISSEMEDKFTILSGPMYVYFNFWDTPRGRELTFENIIHIEPKSDNYPGEFFDVDNLPEDTIELQKQSIRKLASHINDNFLI